MNNNKIYYSETTFPKSIAIVSGKGGSGKTMVTAMVAKIFQKNNISVTLVDGDIATGGLTYYLGLKHIENISLGLSNLLFGKDFKKTNNNDNNELSVEGVFEKFFSKIVQRFKNEDGLRFVGVGDHRRIFKEQEYLSLTSLLNSIIPLLLKESDVVIVDCRGGIDEESLQICKAVDEILLVVETDTTSFQSTQHLVDVLYANDLTEKIKGFIINKAFDDPSSIARNGTSSFRTQYLGAVPFDMSSTREFLVGEIPSTESVFGIQVWSSLKKAYGEKIYNPRGRVLDFKDFKEITLTNVDSMRGGLILSTIILAFIVIFLIQGPPHDSTSFNNDMIASFIIVSLLGLAAGIEPVRKLFGRGITLYIDFLKKMRFYH